jgi:hypothetical protein
MRYDDIRCNTYNKKKLGHFLEPLPASPEFLQSYRAKVTKLFTVHLLNGFVETGQKFQSLRGDSSHNHPTVLRFPTARDQFSFFKTIE